MDLATVILQWKERPLGQWLTAANRYLPSAVSAILVIGIAYQLAKLTWVLIPSGPINTVPANVPTPAPSGAVTTGPGLDVTAVIDAHLFGQASSTPAPVVETQVDAPDTTLSLQLVGVVAMDDPQSGVAIIADSRSGVKKYNVSNSIENTGGAVLHSVYLDRVLLNRAGRLETLRLPQELSSTPTGRVAARAPMPMPQVAADSLREIISDNASALTDVLRFAPFVEAGQMVGYRVNPAQDRAMFESLGLQPNDVITDINGMALNDPSSGLQVFEALGEAKMANVTVIRNGNPEVLIIDTTQLQQLSDGRQ
jgi:general secretion pathway protein C